MEATAASDTLLRAEDMLYATLSAPMFSKVTLAVPLVRDAFEDWWKVVHSGVFHSLSQLDHGRTDVNEENR